MFTFGKPSQELRYEDLEEHLLGAETPEGYFIEYKESVPPSGGDKADKIAKTIAAFANTHGGWLFVGIRADKTANKPVSIPGIDVADGLLEGITSRIAAHVAPIPIFFPYLLECRDHEKCVIAVEVPEGADPPYLMTKTGEIYTRLPTQSEPVPATDRRSIERLYDRGRFSDQERVTFLEDRVYPWLSTFRPAAGGLGHPLAKYLRMAVIISPTALFDPAAVPLFTEGTFSVLRDLQSRTEGRVVSRTDLLKVVDHGAIEYVPLDGREYAGNMPIHALRLHRSGVLVYHRLYQRDATLHPDSLVERIRHVMAYAERFFSAFSYIGGVVVTLRMDGIQGIRLGSSSDGRLHYEGQVCECTVGQLLLDRPVPSARNMSSESDEVTVGFVRDLLRCCGQPMLE